MLLRPAERRRRREDGGGGGTGRGLSHFHRKSGGWRALEEWSTTWAWAAGIDTEAPRGLSSLSLSLSLSLYVTDDVSRRRRPSGCGSSPQLSPTVAPRKNEWMKELFTLLRPLTFLSGFSLRSEEASVRVLFSLSLSPPDRRRRCPSIDCN